LGEEVWRLLDIECLAGGQIQCFARHSDGGFDNSCIKSRNLRRSESFHKPGVLGADLLGLNSKHIGQGVSLVPRNWPDASRELRDEARRHVQPFSDRGLS